MRGFLVLVAALVISCGGDERPSPVDAAVSDAARHDAGPSITPVDAAPVPDAPPVADAAPDAGTSRTPAEQHVYELCQRVGVAFCQKFDMCGLQPYQECLDQFLEICGMSYQVRDEGSLVNMCLPWISTLTCSQLIDPRFNLDPSCYHQFRGR